MYVRAESKLFCACHADFLASPAPNSQVCHVCTGQPGAKPLAPNGVAVRSALRLARALGMRPEPSTRFLRKHYFYPDLPSNYQRTSEPVARGGSLAGCALTELHVEEDPGAYDPREGTIDYDRAGAPLLELVTEPQLTSPAHARQFLAELRLALQYLGIHREAAGMKADCNVSLDGGERVEVKNVNSARNVERALAYEIARQQREQAVRETRHFDEDTGTTIPLRAKETDADYRYLPDPDLAPVALPAGGPLAPEDDPFGRRARIAAAAGVGVEEASPLLEERALADLFDARPTRARFQFLVRDLRAALEPRATTLAASGVPVADLEALLVAREEGQITPQVATRLLRHAFEHRGIGGALAEELERSRSTGTEDALAEAVRAAIDANPKAVADHRAGKQGAVNFLVGQAMRHLKGRGDANALRAAIEAALRP